MNSNVIQVSRNHVIQHYQLFKLTVDPVSSQHLYKITMKIFKYKIYRVEVQGRGCSYTRNMKVVYCSKIH